MRNLIFTSLEIASPSQLSGNRFAFHPRFNLITGPDNSIGKSTLAKLLLWSFGCDPIFDETWLATDSRTVLQFTLDGVPCAVGRTRNTIILKHGLEPFEVFRNITGEYSRRFAGLVGFDVLLPNRTDPPQLESPPPAYYFLPFYIDQRRSWSAAWNSFDGLKQYANWQNAVVPYHTGYLDPEYFQIASMISAEKTAAKLEKQTVDRLSGAIAVVQELAPAVKSVSTGEKIDDLIADIGENVGLLQQQLDEALQYLTFLREDTAQLAAQRKILGVAAIDLGLDYTFAVENTSGDELQCPLCGTIHNNTLIERSGLLAQKAEAEKDLITILHREKQLSLRTSRTETKIRLLRGRMESFALRFQPATEAEGGSSDFITRLSSTAIQKMAARSRDDAASRVGLREKEVRRLKSVQGKLLPKEDKTALNERFQALLSSYVETLGARGVNLSGVETPMNHARLFNSGGAAEGTRAALAYYLAVLTMVQEAGNEVIPPLIVDTPNQHEQTDYNYEAALRLITGKTASFQVFVCGMDTEVIQPYKRHADVIWLEPGNRLLNPDKFQDVWPGIERFFAAMGQS